MNERIQHALSWRSVIDQANGILMARQGCDTDAAFELLRQASQNRNVKLREVAETVVAGGIPRSVEGEAEGGGFEGGSAR